MTYQVTCRQTLGINIKKKAPFEDLDKDLYLKIYGIDRIEESFDISLYSLGIAKMHQLHKIGNCGVVFVYRDNDTKTVCSDVIMYKGKIENLVGIKQPKMIASSIENFDVVERKTNPEMDALEVTVLTAEENCRTNCNIARHFFEEFPDISEVLAKR